MMDKWKNAISGTSSSSTPDGSRIDIIKSNIDSTLSSLNIPQRLKELEQWKGTFADPKIKQNIANLEARYNDVVDIYNKMKATGENLANEIETMKQPIATIISYIGYLKTDYNEIKEALRVGWWKLPDPIAAAIHIGEAIYHMIVINNNLGDVLKGFQNRLFPSMQNSLK